MSRYREVYVQRIVNSLLYPTQTKIYTRIFHCSKKSSLTELNWVKRGRKPVQEYSLAKLPMIDGAARTSRYLPVHQCEDLGVSLLPVTAGVLYWKDGPVYICDLHMYIPRLLYEVHISQQCVSCAISMLECLWAWGSRVGWVKLEY